MLRKDICDDYTWWDSKWENNYSTSNINEYLNNDFLNKFETKFQNIIRRVKIPYCDTDTSGAPILNLSTKPFLLSGSEVGWTSSDSSLFYNDGSKLDYFESGKGSSANNKRIAKYNSSDYNWWLRTIYTSPPDYQAAIYVKTNGDFDSINAYYSEGVRPAFILPFDAQVDFQGNIVT